jgi:hypothetical protein
MTFFRKPAVATAALLALALLLLLPAVIGMRMRLGQVARGWEQVRVGMSKDEVRELLGEPDSVYSAAKAQHAAAVVGLLLLDATQERWAYGRRRTVDFCPQFPYIDLALDGLLSPEDSDRVIYFTADERVVKKQFPYRTP